MLMAAVALVASCTNDLTNDVVLNPDGSEVVNANGGIVLVASVEDVTRVSIDGEGKTSQFNWEVGDELTLVSEGKSYTYVTTQSGRTSEFVVKEGSDAFLPTDLSKPVAVFYNVKEVNAAAMTAVYDVPAIQVAGELSNKMPLYHYSATTVVENGKLVAKMKPLASVVELALGASKSWNIDGASIAVSALQKGTYATAAGAVIDAATGAISLDGATVGNEVKVALGGTVDLQKGANVQMVVMGLTHEATVTETITNEDQTTTEVTTTELYAPIYHGKAVVKTYKGGAENARRTIWASYAPGAEAVNEHKHIYQPITDVLTCKIADGISTPAQMKQFADAVNNTTERYPAGAEFSNEDGVVVLKNSISLEEFENWMAIGCNNDDAQTIKPQFVGIFDGNNNTIEGLYVDHNVTDYKLSFPNADGKMVESIQNNAGLFGVVANGGVIKNLTVEGAIVENMTNDAWSYAGGITAQISGGQIINCTSRVRISASSVSVGKNRVGGIVGRVYASTADILVDNCKNYGTINLDLNDAAGGGQSIVGGIVGFVGDGAAYKPVISNCENNGAVKAFNGGKDTYVGGVIGYVTRKNEVASTFTSLTNKAAVCAGSKNSGCSAIHIGGIVGRLNFHTLKSCVNEGAVSLDERTTSALTPNVGGVIGNANAGADKAAHAEDCTNKGTVTVKGVDTIKSGLCAGGFIGYAQFTLTVKNCKNEGAVYSDAGASSTQTFSGAFAGKVGVAGSGKADGIIFEDCVNDGTFTVLGSTVHTGWQYGGGIAGCCYGGTDITAENVYGIRLKNCVNNGLLKLVGGGSKFRIGGISGLNNCAAWDNCTNNGIVAVEYSSNKEQILAGIAGLIENQYSYVKNCVNNGNMCCLYKTTTELLDDPSKGANTYILLAGIVGGGGGAKALIEGCTNTGDMLASHDDLLEWNADKTAFVANKNTYATTLQYRSAICGNPGAALPVKNCKVGGGIGVVKGGDGEDRYTASVIHPLTNVEGDTYYWAYWLTGYTTPAAYSGMEFYQAQ